MKQNLFYLMALVCVAILPTSCNKNNSNSGAGDEPVPFVGNWIYSGYDTSGEDDLDRFDNHLFEIDDNVINVFKMDGTPNATYSYTRTGNTVTFNPVFNRKYGTATIRKSFGTGAESISWDCGNGQVYNFNKAAE